MKSQVDKLKDSNSRKDFTPLWKDTNQDKSEDINCEIKLNQKRAIPERISLHWEKLPLKQALAVHTALLSLQPPPFLCSSIQLQKKLHF